MKRRTFLTTASAAVGSILAEPLVAKPEAGIALSLKQDMIGGEVTIAEKFRLIKDLGYDGVEMQGPRGLNLKEAIIASKSFSLPIHGSVNGVHWKIKMSSSDEGERAKAVAAMTRCIEEIHQVGGSSVLLVPGVVGGDVTPKLAWERSIVEIRKLLPLASKLGIHILIENVWNGMFYDPKGPNTQSADLLKNYLDEINSPWVGSYFDIGNHQRFGKPAEWIKTLGNRIVKLDVKDWGVKSSFGKIGEGDVDWPAVRAALKDIGYSGWATAEVGGGQKEGLREVLQNMRIHLLGQ
ncbi:MAG: L-ribulose-5-phosphate 3-epimerase [Akkermansiaceae bacterium]|jgi:L-ribulose-5-phosphate 3-epimerase